jgi:transposase-like protein
LSCSEIAIQTKKRKKMTKLQKNYNRYSICFKEQVVQEVAAGASISEVRRRYGIQDMATVQRWLRRFGREELLRTKQTIFRINK